MSRRVTRRAPARPLPAAARGFTHDWCQPSIREAGRCTGRRPLSIGSLLGHASPLSLSGVLAPLPAAHLTHWYFWPLYAAPVLIVLGAAILSSVRQRREDAEADPPGRRR
jgi:hypothetical protein